MNQQIQDALIAQLKLVTGLPVLQEENTVMTPKGNFARATLIRSRPSQLTVGTTGQNLHRGLLQVDLFVPVNTGTTAVNVLADAVIEAFPRGLVLASGDLVVHCVIAYRDTSRRLNDQFHQVPVVVEWQVIA